MKFWLFQNNQVLGPFDRDELANTAGFSLDSLVCPEGRKGKQMGDWQRAGVVSELAEIRSRMTRAPDTASDISTSSFLPPEPTLRDLAVARPGEQAKSVPIDSVKDQGRIVPHHPMEGGVFVAADGSSVAISGIRDSITKWANEVPHHDWRDLGADIELISVRNLPAYRIELCSLIETRMVGWTEEPYHGGPLPKRTVRNPQEVGLWNIRTDAPEGFEKKIQKIDIDGSAESSDCRPCSSKGTTRCGPCVGQGHKKCRSCAGKGETRCGSCNGRGESKCGSCNGRGRAQGFVSGKMETCDSCDGRGRKDCGCGNGNVSCGGCGGAGDVECGDCGGNGEIECSNCNGAGRLVRFLQLVSICSPEAQSSFLCPEDVPGDVSVLLKGLSGLDVDGQISNESSKLTAPQEIIGANHPKVLASAQDLLKTARGECESKSGLMIRQRLRVTRVPCHRVDYRFSGKDYVLWALGATFKIHAGTSPLTDLDAELLGQANQKFEGGETADAFILVEKSIDIASRTGDEATKAQAELLKSWIVSRLNREYFKGALIGVSAAFSFILLIGAYLKFVSFSALFISCLLGGIGGWAISLAGASIASKRNRIRWAAMVSGGLGFMAGIAVQPHSSVALRSWMFIGVVLASVVVWLLQVLFESGVALGSIEKANSILRRWPDWTNRVLMWVTLLSTAILFLIKGIEFVEARRKFTSEGSWSNSSAPSQPVGPSAHPRSMTVKGPPLTIEGPKRGGVVAQAHPKISQEDAIVAARERVRDVAGGSRRSIVWPELFIPENIHDAFRLVTTVWEEEWALAHSIKESKEDGMPFICQTEEAVIKRLGKDWKVQFTAAFIQLKGKETLVIARLACQKEGKLGWELDADGCSQKVGRRFEDRLERLVKLGR